MLPLSVVVPVRDRRDSLAAALAGVAAQTQPPAEVLVVDDGSTDGSGDVAAAAGARVLRRDAPSGAGPARDAGLRAAAYDWVALLDSDDAWEPGHLARLWAARGAHVLVAESGRGTRSGRVYGNPGRRPLRLTDPSDVVFPANCISPTGALLRRDVLLAAGGFGAGLSEDMDAWVRMLERGTGLVLPDVGWRYTEHGGQLSGDRAAMRASHAEVLERYADRPWCTPELLERVAARDRWDALRAGAGGAPGEPPLRGRGYAAWVLADPRRARALGELWWWRLRERRRLGPPTYHVYDH